MVSVIQEPNILGQAIAGAGGILGEALMDRRQKQQQQQQREMLGQILGQADFTQLGGAQDFLSQALSHGADPQVALGVLQQAMAMPSGGIPAPQQASEMSDLLQRLGIDPEQADAYADLYQRVPQGAQTALTKNIAEEIERASGRRGGPEDIQDDAQFPSIDPFEGMSKNEAAKFRLQYRKENEPVFKEASQKLRSLEAEGAGISQLKRLNETADLPSGLGRLNVNWSTGDIRIPAAASPEAQLYVKTINEFTSKAKDTFGARVTNFELGQFLKRLPTLANTKEGRTAIIEQMQAINDLNRVHNKALKDVYAHYGLGKITPEQAEELASQMIQEETTQIMGRMERASLAPEIAARREQVQSGYALIEKDGELRQVPEANIDRAKQLGWTPV